MCLPCASVIMSASTARLGGKVSTEFVQSLWPGAFLRPNGILRFCASLWSWSNVAKVTSIAVVGAPGRQNRFLTSFCLAFADVGAALPWAPHILSIVRDTFVSTGCVQLT